MDLISEHKRAVEEEKIILKFSEISSKKERIRDREERKKIMLIWKEKEQSNRFTNTKAKEPRIQPRATVDHGEDREKERESRAKKGIIRGRKINSDQAREVQRRKSDSNFENALTCLVDLCFDAAWEKWERQGVGRWGDESSEKDEKGSVGWEREEKWGWVVWGSEEE